MALNPIWIAFFLNALDLRLFSMDDEILAPLRCIPSLMITLAATILLLYGRPFEFIFNQSFPWPMGPTMKFILAAFFLELTVRHFWIPLENSLTEGLGHTSLAISKYCTREPTNPWCCLSTLTTYLSDECVLGLITYIVATMILLSVLHAAGIFDLRKAKNLFTYSYWCSKQENEHPPDPPCH